MYALHHMPPGASGPIAGLLQSHIVPWLVQCNPELYESMVCNFLQVRALRTIAAICTMLLSQWSSVPQEDQQALSLGMDSAGLPLSSDMKLAMQFRLEKKRLLLHAVNEISKQIQVSNLRCQPWRSDTFRPCCCNAVKSHVYFAYQCVIKCQCGVCRLCCDYCPCMPWQY